MIPESILFICFHKTLWSVHLLTTDSWYELRKPRNDPQPHTTRFEMISSTTFIHPPALLHTLRNQPCETRNHNVRSRANSSLTQPRDKWAKILQLLTFRWEEAATEVLNKPNVPEGARVHAMSRSNNSENWIFSKFFNFANFTVDGSGGIHVGWTRNLSTA